MKLTKLFWVGFIIGIYVWTWFNSYYFAYSGTFSRSFNKLTAAFFVILLFIITTGIIYGLSVAEGKGFIWRQRVFKPISQCLFGIWGIGIVLFLLSQSHSLRIFNYLESTLF